MYTKEFLKKKFELRSGKVIINSLVSILSRLLNLLSTFITIPILLKSLGKEEFTVYTLITSLMGFLMFSDFGLGFGLQNNIPEYEKNIIKLKRAISSTFFLLLFISILGIFITLLSAPYVQWNTLFNTSSNITNASLAESIQYFLLIYFIGLPFNVAYNYLIGKQLSYKAEKWKFTANLLNFIGVFLIVAFDGKLKTFIIIYFAINAIINFLAFFNTLFNGKISGVAGNLISYKYFDINTIKYLFKIGISYFILQIFTVLLVYIDNFLLSHFLGANKIAEYIPLFKLIGIMNIPLGLFFFQNLIAINDAIAKKDNIWISKTLRRLFYFTVNYSLIFSVIIYFGANSILNIWLGTSVNFNKSLTLAFCIYLFFLNFNSLISNILLGPKFLKYSIVAFPVFSIILLAGKYYFIKNYSLEAMLYFGFICMIFSYLLPAFIMLKRKKYL